MRVGDLKLIIKYDYFSYNLGNGRLCAQCALKVSTTTTTFYGGCFNWKFCKIQSECFGHIKEVKNIVVTMTTTNTHKSSLNIQQASEINSTLLRLYHVHMSEWVCQRLAEKHCMQMYKVSDDSCRRWVPHTTINLSRMKFRFKIICYTRIINCAILLRWRRNGEFVQQSVVPTCTPANLHGVKSALPSQHGMLCRF